MRGQHHGLAAIHEEETSAIDDGNFERRRRSQADRRRISCRGIIGVSLGGATLPVPFFCPLSFLRAASKLAFNRTHAVLSARAPALTVRAWPLFRQAWRKRQ